MAIVFLSESNVYTIIHINSSVPRINLNIAFSIFHVQVKLFLVENVIKMKYNLTESIVNYLLINEGGCRDIYFSTTYQRYKLESPSWLIIVGQNLSGLDSFQSCPLVTGLPCSVD